VAHVVFVRGAAAAVLREAWVCARGAGAAAVLREGALVCVGTHSRSAISYNEILEVKLGLLLG
jgi:hypothetical protein